MRIVIRDDPAAVAETAAAIVRDELAVPGPASLGLAGGSTPAATYRALARADIDWKRVTLWLGDERWVPSDHVESNERMVREQLGAEAAERLVTPDFRLNDPATAAASYEKTLESVFGPTDGAPGSVLLGMGPDGHTASLFPGNQALEIQDRRYVATFVEAHSVWRLTATLPLLAAARHLIFLVTGSEKAEKVAEILAGGASYPAGMVTQRASNVTWILDSSAASALESP